jgi:CRISPR-associated protein Cmr1
MSKMETREYQIRFTTPAFLGNAEQQAQWRTPPFKALLRQWWRVAVAKQYQYDHHKIREMEGRLLGHAWLENDLNEKGKKVSARKSLIQLRISQWEKGNLSPTDWPANGFENVVTTRDGKGRVRADLYMGFGLVLPPSNKEHRSSITLAQEAKLSLRFPKEHAADLDRTLRVLSWFGSAGSRSRNGWGSIHMKGANLEQLKSDSLDSVSRDLESCMEKDWPHAIGFDEEGLLIWLSQPVKGDWRKALSLLAHEKVNIRRVAKRYTGSDRIGGIQLLGYPAGKAWELRELKKDARLASQVRFKVIDTPDGLRSMIFHMPARFPDKLLELLNQTQHNWIKQNELKVMRAIHQHLDGNGKLSRLK